MTTCPHGITPYTCVHCLRTRADTAEATVEQQRVEIERLRLQMRLLIHAAEVRLDDHGDHARRQLNIEIESARAALASKPAPGAGAEPCSKCGQPYDRTCSICSRLFSKCECTAEQKTQAWQDWFAASKIEGTP